MTDVCQDEVVFFFRGVREEVREEGSKGETDRERLGGGNRKEGDVGGCLSAE